MNSYIQPCGERAARNDQDGTAEMDDASQTMHAAIGAGADAAKGSAEAGRQAFGAGAEAMKSGFDRAAAAGDQAFKQAADRSLGALNEMNAQSRRNFEAMIASVTAATRGAEALSAQAVSYAKSAMEGQVEHMRALSSVRSLQEAIELQTSYARSAMEAYVGQMNKAADTLSTAMKDSVQPLSARATEAVETVQAQR